MRRFQGQTAVVLAAAVFAYGLLASVDVFYSGFFLPEEASHHSHAGGRTFCGFVVQTPDYLKLHSLPLLDTFVPPAAVFPRLVAPAVAVPNQPYRSVVFNLVRLRAPPFSS